MVFSIIQKSQLEGAKRLDAEYYQSSFLLNAKKVSDFGFTELNKLSIIDITKGETPLWRGDNYTKTGIPFLRSENLVTSCLDLSNVVFINEKVHERMSRSKIYPGDVLLAIVGATIGQVGLVSDEYPEYNTNQANAIVRPINNKMSAYLSIILETKYCQLQIERLKGGGSRDNLDLHEVRILKIPKPNEILLNFCFQIIQTFQKLYNDAKAKYVEAEKSLLTELKILNFQQANFLSTMINLSELQTVNRFDAEYFNSPCNTMLAQVTKGKTAKLGELVDITKGVEPGADAYQDEPADAEAVAGKRKLFVRVSSISKDGIIDKDQKYLSDDLYNEYKKDYQPQVGEILLTKDASIGVACVVREPVDGIVAGGVLRLKLKEKMNPEYLALVLNSIVGQLQAQRDAGGSIIAHWKPEQIKNLIVPILSVSIQEKISDLVVKSHQARKKAKELLEEAKSKVEEMIEKGQ